MALLFSPAPQVLIPVEASDAQFPVRRVYCVGRNYADHVAEMGGDPAREAPFFFQKNPENLLCPGGIYPYPPLSQDVHHEVELVIFLQSGGSDIPLDEALTHVAGYGVGIDFTRRDLQAAAKKAGKPWMAAKASEQSGPVSALVAAETCGHPEAGRIWLSVNGETRQDGDLAQMSWKVPEIIAELSRLMTLAAGDVIFTGTPAGVGPVRPGDHVACGIDGIATLDITVA